MPGLRLIASPLTALLVVLPASLAGADVVQPLFLYTFDEADGPAVHEHHGGPTGWLVGADHARTDGAFGYAGDRSLHLNPDGRGRSYVEIDGLAGALNGWSALTVSAWVKSDVTSADRAFFGGDVADGCDRFGARYDQAGWKSPGTEAIKLALNIDGRQYQYESASGYQTAEWQHVLFTWASGEGIKLYVDGQLDPALYTDPGLDTATGSITNQTRFALGNGAKDVWAGALDDVAVWDVALSADAVAALAGGRATGTGAASTVPEPATLAILLPAAALLRRRRRI